MIQIIMIDQTLNNKKLINIIIFLLGFITNFNNKNNQQVLIYFNNQMQIKIKILYSHNKINFNKMQFKHKYYNNKIKLVIKYYNVVL
jgi:N-acetylmuramic acid 6-phosphate (MurNAc-6-P) etherase